METLEELQGRCKMIVTSLNDEQSDINLALVHYKRILTSYQQQEDIFDEDQRDYILNYFLEDSVRALMTRKHVNYQADWNMADMITNCCKLLVSIAVPLIKQDCNLSMQIIYFAMNANSPFFSIFGHDWRQKRGCELSEDEMKQLEPWRSTEIGIKEGAHVDYLMGSRWRYGRIQNITIKGTDLRMLHIQPLMEGMYPAHVPSVGIIATEPQINTDEFTFSPQTIGQIAKPLTKSMEQRPQMAKWRKDLRLSQDEEKKQTNIFNTANKCDVLDPVHKWYTCTIVEDDPAANRIKVNYDGWSSRYDEWINRDSMNLQPYLSNAKGGRETQGVSGCLEALEPCLEDEEDSEDVYALWRGKLNGHSFHLIDILNAFGSSGGFDAISDRLNIRVPAIPMVALRHYLSPLSNVYKCYTRRFAEQFVKPLVCLTLNILKSLEENELKDLRQEYLQSILQSVETLMRRHYTEEEVVERMEKFQLLMALKRLRCLNFDRRLEAAQYISSLSEKMTRYQPAFMYSYSWLTQKYLAEWMKENNVLYMLFGPSSEMLYQNTILISGYIRIHYDEKNQYLPSDVMNMIKLWYNEQPDVSIMKQSVDVLHFACAQSVLQFDHVNVLWNIIERVTVNHKEEEDLSAICEVMIELLDSLDEANIDRLISKIKTLDLSAITPDHLKVISVAMKTEDSIADKCFSFLWDVLQDDTECEESLTHSVMELINERNADFRDQFITKCISNLKQHQSVYIALDLLSVLLKNGMNDTERYIMIEHLIDNEKLLKYYLEDVIHFKKYINQQMEQQTVSNGVNQLNLFATKRTYLQEIKQRINFLRFLHKNYERLTLTDEDKAILYSQFIEGAATNEEKKHAIIKLKSVIGGGCDMEDKYPLLQQQIIEDSSEGDDDDNDDEPHSPQGVDPVIFAALGYANSDDAEAQLLYQSLMESQAELYQSFQQ